MFKDFDGNVSFRMTRSSATFWKPVSLLLMYGRLTALSLREDFVQVPLKDCKLLVKIISRNSTLKSVNLCTPIIRRALSLGGLPFSNQDSRAFGAAYISPMTGVHQLAVFGFSISSNTCRLEGFCLNSSDNKPWYKSIVTKGFRYKLIRLDYSRHQIKPIWAVFESC